MPASPAQPPVADPVAALVAAFGAAIRTVLGPEHADADPQIRPSAGADFGDYQANVAMSLAKRMGMNPRDLAMKLAAAVDVRDLAEKPQVAGPGFINITLKPQAISVFLGAMENAGLGVPGDPDPHPIAIDLCGVNVAKQMHVGHLRSTIIGDCLARVLERVGRRVFRENHLGDWGLTIAMTLHQLRQSKVDWDSLELDDLDRAYRAAQLACTPGVPGTPGTPGAPGSPAAEAAEASVKALLIQLQQGEVSVVRDWQKLIDVTMKSVYESFALLNVKLGPENNRAESFYRDQLQGVVDAFVRAGVAVEDAGAIVVKFQDRERPMLIRKSDGGFLYATTDLAAIRYRVQTLGAARVIYVVDARQRDHFRDLFDAAAKIGWDRLPDAPGASGTPGTPGTTRAQLVHVPFGAVLGADKKPLKTRSGENITLKSLLTEAIDRGVAEVSKRAADPEAPTHGLAPGELAAIGKAVGIGAVKYADLSGDLVRDYVFNFDRMIAFEGDTGPYLQYAHARLCSIFARAGLEPADVADAPFTIAETAERQLALALLRYGTVVADVARTLEPHRLCVYLHELANACSAFYQVCPVLKASPEELRRSRLRLCDLTRRVLADGLDLLGIEAPQRM